MYTSHLALDILCTIGGCVICSCWLCEDTVRHKQSKSANSLNLFNQKQCGHRPDSEAAAWGVGAMQGLEIQSIQKTENVIFLIHGPERIIAGTKCMYL